MCAGCFSIVRNTDQKIQSLDFKRINSKAGFKQFINMRILCIYFELLCFLCMALLQGYPTVIMKHIGPTVVQTKYGRLRGRLVEFPLFAQSDLKKPVEAYFGIQYASVRESKLRFVFSNSPTRTWKGLHTAAKEMPVCPQKVVRAKTLLEHNMPVGTVDMFTRMSSMTQNQTEDCLSLNLYVPMREWNETEKLPVMIFVHGESYEVGTGNAYDGSVLASYGNVIVITVNYRLGVLGFFSTGDKHAEGNYALWDLLAILYWVKENIDKFGGDRHRVTLFGHGHGAALVNLLLFTNIVKEKDDLFNNVILQSGSALSTWATSINPARCAYLLAQQVNCSNHVSRSEDLVSCLRNKTVEELVRSVPLTPKYYTCFAPVVGQSTLFSGKTLQQMIDARDTKFASTKIMFGVTRKEAYSYLKQNEIENGISEYKKKQYLRTYVNNVFKCNKQKIYDILDLQYTHWDEPQDDKTRRDDVMDMISDGQYKAPLVKMALEHAKTADTYMYSFAYSTQSEEYPQWSGGVHGDELPYIFGAPLVEGLSPFPSKYSPQEKELSKIMMRMWTNFAKTGDPNTPEFHIDSSKDCSDTDDIPRQRWPKYNSTKQSYLHITKKCVKAKDFYRASELARWLKLIPKFNRRGPEEDDSTHELDNAANISTYDDPNRLLARFYSFPPSPIPPLPPRDWTGWQQETTEKTVPTTPEIKVVDTTPIKKSATVEIKPVESKRPSSENTKSNNVEKSAIPLSITVAIGCALIFLNLLICAGMYYQRERIKKLREGQRRGNGIDINDTRNNDRSKSRDVTPPEAVNLVHSPDTTLPKVTNMNHKSHMDHVPMYTTVAKPVGPPQGPGGYTYSALSQKPSPMHSHNHVHYAAHAPHTGQHTGPPSEDGSQSSSSKGLSSSARPPGGPDRSPRIDTRAKHIPGGTHQVTSNNAITIV